MEKIIVKEFRAAKDILIKIIDSLDEERLNTVPFPQSWTAGQVADHLLKSFRTWTLFYGTTSVANRRSNKNCKSLSDSFLNFEVKMTVEPSDFIYPSIDYIKKEPLLAEIRTTTDDIIDFANQNDIDLICSDVEFPTLGYLTRLEWLHFYMVHTQRHTHQLKNIIHQLKNSIK